jgi:hypothetical protein
MTNLRTVTALVSTAASLALSTPVQAYPVDCAILLCLAGGWPASVECAHARTVFIRRITPWPIEPPLQIWNCPMRVSYPALSAVERLVDVAATARNLEYMATPAQDAQLLLPVVAQADVDISDPVFDFVRSIHVFEIGYSQRRNRDGDCIVSTAIRRGSYGAQGDYRRQRSNVATVPAASGFDIPAFCRNYRYRSVFVDWRDQGGTYGHEEVHY